MVSARTGGETYLRPPILIRIVGGGHGQPGNAPVAIKEKDAWDRLDILGKLAQGFLGISISALAAMFSFQANQAVNRHNQQQDTLNSLDQQAKSLQSLGEAEPKKKLGKIALAGYGESALPALGALLEQPDDALRADGIDTAAYSYAMHPDLRSKLLPMVKSSLVNPDLALSEPVMTSLKNLSQELSSGEKMEVVSVLLDRFEPFIHGKTGDVESLKQALIFLRSSPGGRCSDMMLALGRQKALGPEIWDASLLALDAHIDSGKLPKSEMEKMRSDLQGPAYAHLLSAGYMARTIQKLNQAIPSAPAELR